MKAIQCLLLVFGLVSNSFQADRPFFQPYGPTNGDATLHRNDDEFTDPVTLIGGMNFFGGVRQTLYVDNNGIITLDESSWVYTPDSMDILTVATIAPFWSDVDTRPSNGGFLYYRSTLDPIVADNVSAFIRAANPGSTFTGTRSFIATWKDVGYYSNKVDKKNTFQCVLVADDLGTTYALFNYGDITWTTGDASGGTNGLGGTPAVVGFAKGSDGIYSQLPDSLTNNIVNVELGTNVYINGVPQTGQYLFSVGEGVVITPCCSLSNPPVLSGTPTVLNYNVNDIDDIPDFTGTVTATYQCSSPVTEVIQPVIFSVYGCPVTRTWTGTDDCLKETSVQQVFTYPEVFSEPLKLNTPNDYLIVGSCSNPVAPSPSVSGQGTSNRGTVTYTDTVWTSTTNKCSMTRYWIAEDICNTFQYGTQTITYDATPPATTGALTTRGLTTKPLTTQPLTTQELTTQELTTSRLTTQELTTSRLTTQPLTTQPLTTQPLTTKPVTTQSLTTQPLTTKDITTQPLTTQPLTTQPLTTKDITTQPLTTQPLTTQELTTQPLTTQELTTQPLTTQELTTQPLTTKDITTQPLTTQPLTTQELTTQELTTQPLTTKDITTQPLTTQPLTTKGLTTQPLTTSFYTVAARCATYVWPETQGYFCAADGSGYYQCLKGPYAPQANFRPCAPGTSCKCGVGVECSATGICTYGPWLGPY